MEAELAKETLSPFPVMTMHILFIQLWRERSGNLTEKQQIQRLKEALEEMQRRDLIQLLGW